MPQLMNVTKDEATMIGVEHSGLGKKSTYTAHYDPRVLVLFPIARAPKRLEIGVPTPLPFYGSDIWNHYEVSWLNPKGKPLVAIAKLVVPATSVYLIESKSMKLYFNSLNNTAFASIDEVRATLEKDLSAAVQAKVEVQLTLLKDLQSEIIQPGFAGIHLDTLDVECAHYLPAPQLLTVADEVVSETLTSDLLKSNCLVTGQPDWASIQIQYSGQKINHANLLQYLVSFRNHNEFHEQCVERIFMDILNYCQPEKLSVYACYTRRGGIDINPFRTSEQVFTLPESVRLLRQ